MKKQIPIIKQTLSADGKSVFQSIVGATNPGSNKLQFPYELPVIKTEVNISPETMTSLYIVSGIIGGALVLSQIIKRV